MQVICVVSPKGWRVAARIVGTSAPQVGDQCTVTDTYQCACGKHNMYDLAECKGLSGFDARCFATLPGLDADEIDDVQKEAIVPSPIYK